MDLLEKARAFAAQRHADHGCTYGTHDFDYHLNAVEQVLRRFGHEAETLLVAAHLHDVVEDTPTTFDELSEHFGFTVCRLVKGVTDVTHDEQGHPLPNRRARQTVTYQRLRSIAATHPNVVHLKLADRIANVEASMVGINSRHLGMYVRENPFFCREIGAVGGDPKMWDHLDKLLAKDPRRGLLRRLAMAVADPEITRFLETAPPDLMKPLQELIATL